MIEARKLRKERKEGVENSLFNSLLLFSPVCLACFAVYYFSELTKLSEFENSVN
jgi:hypothetical protein